MAIQNPGAQLFGLQYHPEVVHSKNGVKTLKQFLFGVAAINADWKMANVLDEEMAKIRSLVRHVPSPLPARGQHPRNFDYSYHINVAKTCTIPIGALLHVSCSSQGARDMLDMAKISALMCCAHRHREHSCEFSRGND